MQSMRKHYEGRSESSQVRLSAYT